MYLSRYVWMYFFLSLSLYIYKMQLQNDRIFMNLPGATTEVAALKQALSEAENKAA